MSIENYLFLFLCFPDYVLAVSSWGNEVILINVVDVQDLIVMAVIGLDDTTLSALPLL